MVVQDSVPARHIIENEESLEDKVKALHVPEKAITEVKEVLYIILVTLTTFSRFI